MSDYADSNLKRRSSISKDYLPAGATTSATTDWLRKSIRRSWTISNAEDDNGATRDPDVQPYPNPHLPRKQSQSSYPSLVKHPYFNPLSMADEDEYGEEEEAMAAAEEHMGGNHRPSAALRRAMPPRQSTLPNPDGGAIYYGSNNNLMPPGAASVSPKQQLSPSPQYGTSPYHTDNEADNETGSDHRSPLAARYKIRRQSTLPCKPNEMQLEGGSGVGGGGPLHGSGPKIMMSSSPNSRTNLYSKSPERDGLDTIMSKQQQQQRFPPFPLQSQQQQQQGPPPVGQQRQLPTSPNRLVFNKSPDSGTESGPGASESAGTSPHQVGPGGRGGARPGSYQMTRQATLPNPEQHMKLLPTSPPKKQLSPHSIKRSPDFARQNTLPAGAMAPAQQQQPVAPGGPQSAPVLLPMALAAASSCSSLVGTDGTGTGGAPAGVTMNSLSVHQHGPKFMPISPRQKASFLFPQPAAPAPRPFHSQQHFPTHLNTSPSASTVSSGVVGGAAIGGGGPIAGVSHSSSTSLASAVASKMIKVRSHSNEEYTMAPAARAPPALLGMGTVSEGRRMLPEIPTGGGGPGGSRSPRLVRQEHVRDELLIGGAGHSVAGHGPHTADKRTTTSSSSSSSPKQKTFAEAKQTMAAAEDGTMMMGYELYGGGPAAAAAASSGYDEFYDEDQGFSLGPIETVGYQDGEEAERGGNEAFMLMQNQQQQRLPFVPNDSSPDSVGGTPGVSYGMANRKDRLRSRRKSRDVYDHQDELGGGGTSAMIDGVDSAVGGGPAVAAHVSEPTKRKPETMRSISEEAPAAKPPKPITRRSLSHPEKDTQVYNSKKLDSSKIPSPKPLTELQDRQHKPSSAIGSSTSPRRKNIKSFDCGTITSKASNLQPGSYGAQQYQTPDTGAGSGGPSSVSPGIVTESSCSSNNTRTSGYGGSATTLAGNVPGGGGGLAGTGGGAIGGFQSFGQRKISAFQQILQRQRLQKRDSKSLDIVASKLMEEKYGSRGQDVDVSKSLDDGIFSESAGHQSDDNSSDEHINLTYKPPSSKDNKTTLGEAEIQNAVEAAAVIFKKVVLQRREENKCKPSNANHECHSSADGLTDESGTLGGYSSSETEAAGRMQSIGGQQSVRPGAAAMLPPDYEEYRLVFFSSDSSSKEEEYDSSSTTSSTAMRHARRHRYSAAASAPPLDECDWDYFEPDMMPGADEAKSAFFYEMLAMATGMGKCEGLSHGQCANAATGSTAKASGTRKPDTQPPTSAPSSQPFCHCECCNRRQMQYVPIPVPVPVPVPIAAFQSWLYEQQQQLLLMHGAGGATADTLAGGASSEFAIRTDLMQQLWQKFAESEAASVRSSVAPEPEPSTVGRKQQQQLPNYPKCACRVGGGSARRELLEATCATSESHDSSDNERNAATKVRTCKHLTARHSKSGSGSGGGGGGAESERVFGTGRSPVSTVGAVSASNASTAGSVSVGVGGRVHVQKAAPSSPTGAVGSVSDSARRCSSLRSSDRDSSSSSSVVDEADAAAAAAAAALQLLHWGGVVVPPVRAGEFPVTAAVPVTASAANDIIAIQAQDNSGGRSRLPETREIAPDSNVRASGAATSSSAPSSAGGTTTIAAAGAAGLDTMEQQLAIVSPDGLPDIALQQREPPTAPQQSVEASAAQQFGAARDMANGDDNRVASDNRPGAGIDKRTVNDGDDTPPAANETVVKAREAATATTSRGAEEASERKEVKQCDRSEWLGKGSKNSTMVMVGEGQPDGHLQYELLYHLAQTGGRSSPSSSSASSSEAESTTTAALEQQQEGEVGGGGTRKVRVGKYSFHLAGGSNSNSPYATSASSAASSLRERGSSSSASSDSEDGGERREDDDDDDDDDGCCFDGDDDEEEERRLPRGAGGSSGRGKRFSAVMVINPGRGSSGSSGSSDDDDGEGPTDTDSDNNNDNQSIKAEANRRRYSEIAGFPPAGGYDDDSGGSGGIVVLKRVKNISPDRGEEQTDDKLVRQSAEVSIEEQNESIVGSGRRSAPPSTEAANAAMALVDHGQQQQGSSNVEQRQCDDEVVGGSRISGNTDSSSPPANVERSANAGETYAHNEPPQQQQQKLEEKGALDTLALDADCCQQKHPPEQQQQQQQGDSIKVEEKPQHHAHHQAGESSSCTDGNSISSVTGVYRVRTPTPAQGCANACVSDATTECECVGGGATTSSTGCSVAALGDIRSPLTTPQSSSNGNSSNKFTSLVMITAAGPSSRVASDHRESVNDGSETNEEAGLEAAEIQVNVASSSTPTTVLVLPESGPAERASEEEVVHVLSPSVAVVPDEVTQQQQLLLKHTTASVTETTCPSLPECLPAQRPAGSSGSGTMQQQHHHVHTTAAVQQPSSSSAAGADAAEHDRKSSTEGYEQNPATTLIAAAGAPLELDHRPVMDEGARSDDSVDRGSDCDESYPRQCVPVQREGENDDAAADGVGSDGGENFVSFDSMEEAAAAQLYSSEMERYAGDDDDGDDMQNGNVTQGENVTVTTGSATLSAVICLEDGLADDDSWVEEISQDEEEFATTTATDSDLDDSSEEMSFANDREEELRGYNRTAIDFTLHTIVEESCEDSEMEGRGSAGTHGRKRGRGRARGAGGGEHGFDAGGRGGDDEDDDDDDGDNRRDPANRLSASELEKYFFYGLSGDVGGGSSSKHGGAVDGADGAGGTGYGMMLHDEQSEMSEESSSLCSDGHDSLGSGTASGSASAARLSGASFESHDPEDDEQGDHSADSVADLASSRLEKYFLTGFLGYNSTSDRGNGGGASGGGVGNGGGGNGSDGSGGSVGSDSEGHASPEQRRKRLVRARGATRSHSSLDNLLLAGKESEQQQHGHESIGSNVSQSGGGSSYDATGMIAGSGGGGGPSSGNAVIGGSGDLDNSSETDTCDESASALYAHQERTESASLHDTIGKRKKKFMAKKMDAALARAEQQQHHALTGDAGPGAIGSESEDSRKTPLPSIPLDAGGSLVAPGSPSLLPVAGIENSRKQTSRDSGFIGSNDDLLKEDQAGSASKAIATATVEPILEEGKADIKEGGSEMLSAEAQRAPESSITARPPISPGSAGGLPKGGLVNLVRKDSFNNWSSDEETNLMMSKMRQFFKSLVAASANTRKLPNSTGSTPGVSGSNTPQQGGSTPVARPRAASMRTKPPQLVYFESELTRLMKTVPGIRDEQVREIVEYLSSEDTWSDSYDSSDYTSSDLEGTAAAAAVVGGNPFGLQEEISASCRQIISKFDGSSARKDEEGDIGDGGLVTVAQKEESPLIAHHRHHHLQQQQQQHQPPYHQTPLSKETAFVYQRLVASLSKVVVSEPPARVDTSDEPIDSGANESAATGTAGAANNSSSSPPLIAKVMHHIGSRLVALMHEVSSGESHASVSPKQHRISSHRKSGQTMLPGGGIGAAGASASATGAMGHHHHHLHHHHHHHHQHISATTTEDDEDSSTSESNERQHHYHHHRARGAAVGAIAPGPTTLTGGPEEEDEMGAGEGGAAGMSSSSSASYAMMLPRSKSHDLLLSDQRTQGQYQYPYSGTGSDMVGEERGEASDYERFSWRGSFESALLANGDSRTKLSMLDNSSSSKSILVAKRRSAGDLLFNNQNLSQEQLDRVRSCGSIGGDREELWEAKQQQSHHYNQQYLQVQQQQQPHQQHHHQHYPPSSSTSGSRRRLSSVAADEEDTDSDEGVMKGGSSNRLVLASRSTLPRSLQNTTMTSGTTNSLPRLPTSNLQTIMQSVASSSAGSSAPGTPGSSLVVSGSSSKPLSATTGSSSGGGVGMGQKSQSVYHFLQNNVKSARYRAPGFNRPPSAPKRAMSAPGLQPPYPRRERRNRMQQLSNEESHSPELTGSTGALGTEDDPHGSGGSRSAAGDGYDRQGDGTASNGMQHKGGSIVSSPVGSAGGASDNWPSQSDEDIDRLVALHQNRASLSSLGVRSDSMASVYSGAGEGRYGTVTVRGQIEFGMQYNYKQGALEIHVKQCKDLAAVDTKRNRSDPYVKVYLLPDKSKSGKRKTKVKKHTLNPVFDEVLRFHMSLNSLQTRTIWITVWHSDMFGRNDFLGEVMMGLQDKVFDNPQPQWYQLQERSEPFEDLSAYKGDIIVGLKYVSADADGGGIMGAGSGVIGGSGGSTSSGFGTLNLRKFSTRSLTSNSSSTLSGHSKGALHVLVKEAKHLQPIKSNGTCDAFCKSYLLPDKNRSSKQKTPVIKRTNSPVWNYTFVYEDVSLAELSERALELTIWDHDRLASNEFLGGVRFSLGNGKHNGRAVEWMDSTGKELSLWQNMINRPNFWVEGALVLRPSLENAKFST